MSFQSKWKSFGLFLKCLLRIEDYNPDQPHTERKDRPEWDYACMLGVLAVYDDGPCEVNSYCQCGENGIATKASMAVAGQSFRVIKRIAPNIVKVVFR